MLTTSHDQVLYKAEGRVYNACLLRHLQICLLLPWKADVTKQADVCCCTYINCCKFPLSWPGLLNGLHWV